MWRLYFYGEIATVETTSLGRLAEFVRVIGVPDDLTWFEMADIEWQAVNSGYIYRQFAGSLDTKPELKLVHQR